MMEMAGYPKPTAEKFRSLFHLPMWDVIEELTGLESETEIKKLWEMGKGRAVPYDFSLLATPPGVAEVIMNLSRKYQLAVVTSRVGQNVFEAPQLTPMEKYFPTLVAYEDTPNHKPHPDPLLLAAKRLGFKPSECVYVGDMPSDIKAARAAGMKIVLYSAQNIPGADAETADFGKLPGLIESI